jgi:hypothetical protein
VQNFFEKILNFFFKNVSRLVFEKFVDSGCKFFVLIGQKPFEVQTPTMLFQKGELFFGLTAPT